MSVSAVYGPQQKCRRAHHAPLSLPKLWQGLQGKSDWAGLKKIKYLKIVRKPRIYELTSGGTLVISLISVPGQAAPGNLPGRTNFTGTSGYTLERGNTGN